MFVKCKSKQIEFLSARPRKRHQISVCALSILATQVSGFSPQRLVSEVTFGQVPTNVPINAVYKLSWAPHAALPTF